MVNGFFSVSIHAIKEKEEKDVNLSYGDYWYFQWHGKVYGPYVSDKEALEMREYITGE